MRLIFFSSHAASVCILLVHWYDWYQWNIIHSIGILLVKCILLWGLRIFSSASCCKGVHSTCPLARLVPMEYHSFHWYSIGEMHLIMGYFSWLQGEWGCILLVHWSDWCYTNGIYQWNNIYSIGIPFVKCVSLWLSGGAFYLSIIPSVFH